MYWLVGAFFGQGDDWTDVFIRRGYWEPGRVEGDNPGMDDKIQAIRPGHGIAIKRGLGAGQSEILIRAIGIVTEVEIIEAEDVSWRRVYVDWKNTYSDRRVDSKGCYGTIHGPFDNLNNGDWLDEVFRLV